MKLGIMQPYFLPYIGYWQLMNAVDEYVILDEVNYIKGGWINRNRILVDNQPHMLTLPVHKASSFKRINETHLEGIPEKLARTIEFAYHKAPYYKETKHLLDQVLSCPETNLAKFLANSIKLIASRLNIRAKIQLSSELDHDFSCKGQDRVLDICRRKGASVYLNAIGGQALYSRDAFADQGIQLGFVQSTLCPYPQFGGPFVPGLSILDCLMFNNLDDMAKLLSSFTII